MTEQEWNESADIEKMLDFAQPSQRKCRLFSVACCRLVLHHYKCDIEVLDTCLRDMERFADGELTDLWRQHYHQVLLRINQGTSSSSPIHGLVVGVLFTCAPYRDDLTARRFVFAGIINATTPYSPERNAAADLLRHMVPYDDRTRVERLRRY